MEYNSKEQIIFIPKSFYTIIGEEDLNPENL
jgi:hypothetical protein